MVSWKVELTRWKTKKVVDRQEFEDVLDEFGEGEDFLCGLDGERVRRLLLWRSAVGQRSGFRWWSIPRLRRPPWSRASCGADVTLMKLVCYKCGGSSPTWSKHVEFEEAALEAAKFRTKPSSFACENHGMPHHQRKVQLTSLPFDDKPRTLAFQYSLS